MVLIKMGEIRAKFPPQETIRSDFSIKSPTATAGVRGTVFIVKFDVEKQITTVTTIEGRVEVTPENRSLTAVTVVAGQEVLVTANKIGPVYSIGPNAGQVTEKITVPAGSMITPDQVMFGKLLEGQEMVNANGYRWFELSSQDPKLCEQLCARDPLCKAFTYLRPGTYNDPRTRCGVCDGSGIFIPNPGAVSGVKVKQ